MSLILDETFEVAGCNMVCETCLFSSQSVKVNNVCSRKSSTNVLGFKGSGALEGLCRK